MFTVGSPMWAVSGPAKPFTINFEEPGTPSSFPVDIGSFYAASNLVTFGIDIYFADHTYTNGFIGTSCPTAARSGTKFAHFFRSGGSFIMTFDVALAARKITFYLQRGSGWAASVVIGGSGGQSRSYATTGGSVSSWTLYTVDLDDVPFNDPAFWGADFITEIRMNVSTFGVMAVEDLTVY